MGVPIWTVWLWAGLVSVGVVFGLVARIRSKDAQKRTNQRLQHIESQLSTFTEMKGKVDSTRDDVAIIKRLLMKDRNGH